MTYTADQARQELLDALAEVVDALGDALGALGDAYEQLDEAGADRLEEHLFRPVQVAYGRAQRTHAAFAERHGLPTRRFSPASPGLPSAGVPAFVERAVECVDMAEEELVALQDSMKPVEVGDPELRAGLADIREHVGRLRSDAREFMRTFGR